MNNFDAAGLQYVNVAGGCSSAQQMAQQVGAPGTNLFCPEGMQGPGPSVADLYNASGEGIGFAQPGGTPTGLLGEGESDHLGRIRDGDYGVRGWNWVAGDDITTLGQYYVPPNVDQKVFAAFLLGVAFGSNAVGYDDQVQVFARLVGFTYNVRIPGDPISLLFAAMVGYADPVTFVHHGNPSFYLSLFFGPAAHVVANPNGVEGHFDRFGPYNPLHVLLEWLPAYVIHPDRTATDRAYTCSIARGCAATGRGLGGGR